MKKLDPTMARQVAQAVSVFRSGWGLVHFSARNRVWREQRRPKTWPCPLHAAQGGQSHFRGDNAGWRRNIHGAAKIGTVPWGRLPVVLSDDTLVVTPHAALSPAEKAMAAVQEAFEASQTQSERVDLDIEVAPNDGWQTRRCTLAETTEEDRSNELALTNEFSFTEEN